MSLIMAIMTQFPVALMVELMNCNPLDFHVSDLTTSPNPYMINSNLIAKSKLRPKAQFNNSSVKLNYKHGLGTSNGLSGRNSHIICTLLFTEFESESFMSNKFLFIHIIILLTSLFSIAIFIPTIYSTYSQVTGNFIR